MVLRKPSPAGSALPYPVTPVSPPLAQDMASPLKAHADAFSSSDHTLLASEDRPFHDAQEHENGDQGNPWAAAADEEQQIHRSLPTVLRAGSAPRSTEDLQTKKGLAELPQWEAPGAITPRSSSDSQRSRDFWEDVEQEMAESDARPQDDGNRQTNSLQVPNTLKDNIKDNSTEHAHPPPTSPSLSTMKRKPVGSSEHSQPSLGPRSPSYDFASNNPFRQPVPGESSVQQHRPVQQDSHVWSGHSHEPEAAQGKGKEIIRDAPMDGTPIQMTANLSVDDSPFEEDSTSYRPSNINLNSAYRSHEQSVDAPPPSPPPHPSVPPPPPPPAVDEQVDLASAPPGPIPDPNAWPPERHSEPLDSSGGRPPMFMSRDYEQDLEFYKGQEMGVVSREQWLAELEDQVDEPTGPPLPARPSLQSLVNDQRPPLPTRHGPPNLMDEPGPTLPARPAQMSLLDKPGETYPARGHPAPDHAPPKPPRPAGRSETVNEATLQKLKEQRNETYQIKHFNWFDHNTNRLRRSSMLTQNKNGPCPLLALVNALILRKPNDADSALGNALRAREQVSLGLLVESLMDELTSESRENALKELPDVDELNRFLLRLHTGMNANPRFVAPESPAPNLMDARNSILHVPLSINTDRKPGTFEQTQDLSLYGAFAIPLVHGWLPQRSDPARAAFARSAPTYEDAQTIQFGEEELDIKLRQGGLTPNEQQLWEDIVAIRSFFSTYPTQLTPCGLNVVSESLFPGSFAIMFRNDHFSTIYKHPETGQLYTLVTDAGYADKDEIVWESLVDVNGQASEFFSGDFRPVGNVDEVIDSPPEPSSHRNSSSHLTEPLHGAPPTSPQEIQEQRDADFAMALQLQEEEQAQQQSANARRRTTHSRHTSASGPPSSIPIRLRPADAGPAVPPRNQRSNPGVNRPTDPAVDDDAPPKYEEAVKGAPYIPPPGHPQHPASDPSPRASTSAITPMVSAPSVAPRPAPPRAPPQPSRGPQHQRRMSAYQEAQQYGRFETDRPVAHNATMGLQGQPAGRRAQREQDKECIVM